MSHVNEGAPRRGRAPVVSPRHFEQVLVEGASNPLVGRKRELRRLLELWDEAVGGRGTFILLKGEPGIGKSRLAQELSRRARPCPRASRGQCWPQLANSAFYPFVQLLRRLPEASREEAGLTPEQEQALELLLAGSLPAESPLRQLRPERQKELIFEAAGALLAGKAAREPLLLVIEDLHWADPSTLQLLGFLLERLATARICVLLTARPGLAHPWAGRPGFHELAIARLGPGSTAALVREAAHGRALPDGMVRQLVAKTQGIPLFVEEMTRMVLEGEALPSFIPFTLHELLLARLDPLPPRQKRLAQVAAVVGRSFTGPLLAWLSGRSGERLDRDLDALRKAGLLRLQGDAAEPTWQFRHALLQDAAYRSLPSRARRRLHRRIARLLEEGAPRTVEEHPELLAHHYTEAGEVGPAIRYWKQAGLRAAQRFACAESVSHLTRALQLLRGLPDADQRLPEELQLQLALATPLMLLQGFASPEVEQAITRVCDLLRRLGEEPLDVDVPLWGLFAHLVTRSKFQLARELATQVLAMGERRGNEEQIAFAHQLLAVTLLHLGELRAGLRHVEEVLANPNLDLERLRSIVAKSTIEPKVSSLSYGAILLAALGEADRSREYGEEALRVAEQLGHPYLIAGAGSFAATASKLRGEPEAVLACTERSLALSRDNRFLVWLGMSATLRAWALNELGSPREAAELLGEGLEQWRASGYRGTLGPDLHAEVDLALGRWREGLAAVDAALEDGARTGERYLESELLRVRGELLRRSGDELQAEECFRRAIEVARRQEARAFEHRAMRALDRQQKELGREEAPTAPGPG